MARINVEERLYSDKRWTKLVIKLQDEEKALGALVRAWSTAQHYWKLNDHGIPKGVWKTQELNNALIDAGLAIENGDFIKMVDSEIHFAWIRQKVKAGQAGGIESGKSRVEKIEEFPKQDEADGSADKRSEASSSSSSSYSNSLNTKYTKGEKNLKIVSDGALEAKPLGTQLKLISETQIQKNPVKKKPAVEGVNVLIAEYVKAYQKRYGSKTRPDVSGKVQGEMGRLLQDLPLDRIVELIQVYLQMDDRWFLTKAHDFTTFVGNINKISLALDTGQNPDSKITNWDEVFKEGK